MPGLARLRFLLWAARLRGRLRRRGVALVLRAPHGARMDGPPRVRVSGTGDGGTLTVTLGRGVALGSDLHLEVLGGADSSLTVGDGVYFQHAVRVQLRGGSIALGEHTHVRDGAVLKADGALTVGEEVTIGSGDVLACTRRIEIGDRAGLGERVTITDSDHTHDGSDRHYLRQPLRITPVRVGANVLVSAGAVVLRGAEVGANAVIAANAVVGAGPHEGGWLYAGTPARPVKRLGPSA